MLDNGSRPTIQDDQGLTPVDIAAMCGQLDTVYTPVDRGANLTNVSTDGGTILHHGVLSWSPQMIEYLLSRNAVDVNAVDQYGYTALHYAVQPPTLKDVDLGHHKHEFNRLTVPEDQLCIIQHLVGANNVDLNIRNLNEEIPLMLAVSLNQSQAAAILITNGADVNTQNVEGESVLLIASECGDDATVRLLLDYGESTDLADKSGRTPLTATTISNDIRSVLQLYHKRCLALLNAQVVAPTANDLLELVPLITSVYDLRLMVTLVSLCDSTTSRSEALLAAFDHVVTDKLTVDDKEFFILDHRAEKGNTESAEWVVALKKHMHANSWWLYRHEQQLESIVDTLTQVHEAVVVNRAIVVSAINRIQTFQVQLSQGRELLHQLSVFVQHLPGQTTNFQQHLTRCDKNIQLVATTNLFNFREAYLHQLEQEETNKRINMLCGIVASVAGFVIGPVLEEIADAVVDFANPVEIVTKVYGEVDIASFLTNQSNSTLPGVIQNQLEKKYAIPENKFEAVLREGVASLHPEIVEKCIQRGLEVDVDGGRSSVVQTLVLPSLDAEEAVLVELLKELQVAVYEESVSSERQVMMESQTVE